MIIQDKVREQIITGRELMTFRGHSHTDLEELLICLRGVASIRLGGGPVEGRTFSLLPGQIYLLEPGVEHMIWDGSEEKNTRYYNAYYRGRSPLFHSLTGQIFEADLLDIRPFWLEFEADYQAGVVRRRAFDQEESLLKILTLLTALAGLAETDTGKPRPAVKAQSASENIREQLRRIIGSDLSRNHRLSDLGRCFNLEPKYLSAKVKRITSLPVMRLYYQVKMEEATALLANGNSVKETAYRLGFANPYHFSRKYKEICGRSPGEVRSRIP